MAIHLPHNGWMARDHQLNLWEYLTRDGKRAMAVWHRRAGKDEVALHAAAVSAARRPANLWHCLPEYAQCRKAIWNAVNPHSGKRRIDEAFPPEWRTNVNDSEMLLRFHNGSTWQLIGSDQFDRTVGASPAGIVYSEWALANPSAWAYHRPMLEENNGWALFITTPRGHNHAKAMFDYASHAPGWFCELLSVKQTHALSKEALSETLRELKALYGDEMGAAQYEQEYLCSFNAAILGAFYSLQVAQVRAEGRIAEIEPVKGRPVNRCWDLGMRDDTAIWLYQIVGTQVHLYDCIATSGASLEWWRDEIDRIYKERGWLHGIDHVPHDAKVRELGTGKTRVETMQALGLAPALVPDATLQDGINAVRRTLPYCVFHPRCEALGLAALEQYRREWDDEKKAFRAIAVHDWTSHPADSFRYLALSWKKSDALPPTPDPAKAGGWRIPPPPERKPGGLRL